MLGYKRKSKGPKHRCVYCGGTRGKFVKVSTGKFMLDYHVTCLEHFKRISHA